MLSKRGHAAGLQSIIDRGEATTLEEAQAVLSMRGRAVSLQNIIDRGEAATLEEAAQVWSRQGRTALLQNIIDRGDATTFEEAAQVLSLQARAASLQKIIDRGEASNMEEAAKVLSSQANTAALQNMIDRGEATTLEEAQQIRSSRNRAAAAAKDPLGTVGVSMNGGVAAAIAAGKYTKYPGVRWRKDTKKWRVQFSVRGKKVSLGSYLTEEEAAKVHDDYVRKNGLTRPPARGSVGCNCRGFSICVALPSLI